jgi:hypothetical protein
MPPPPLPLKPLKRRISLLLLVSVFFSSWAFYNTLSKPYGFDLGCVTFTLVSMVCFWMLCELKGGRVGVSSNYSLAASMFLVVLNYGLGAYLASTEQGGGGESGNTTSYYTRYTVYCIIFTILWSVGGMYYFRIVYRYRIGNGINGSVDNHFGGSNYHAIENVA